MNSLDHKPRRKKCTVSVADASSRADGRDRIPRARSLEDPAAPPVDGAGVRCLSAARGTGVHRFAPRLYKAQAKLQILKQDAAASLSDNSQADAAATSDALDFNLVGADAGQRAQVQQPGAAGHP